MHKRLEFSNFNFPNCNLVMSDKLTISEKVDVLKHISQIHRQQFDERRKYEWKAFYTTLTLYVLIAVSKFDNDLNVPKNQIFKYFLIIIVIALGILSIGFLISVFKANRINKTIAHNSEDVIRELLIDSQSSSEWDIYNERKLILTPKPDTMKTHNKYWAPVFQISTIVAIGIMTIMIWWN
jgi:hypothetical protein